ncbi:hypothetical protein DdX_16246 [Ditylenchus destructor]|uniref:Uncharacterized protein n=1 Tax=Ditylenchus destructor TaxID=166010 RepID=A0AAD4MTW7_9BILA|nr:hypothetical protein DdX_16246 [Ditylenchus destructor]
MPPKQSKPQVPMETRSRAKAKKNAETQPPVDAKRSRTDNRQAADEDDAPRREKTSECYKSESLKVDCFSRLLPRSDAVLNKIALNNSEMLQSVDINSETALDSRESNSTHNETLKCYFCASRDYLPAWAEDKLIHTADFNNSYSHSHMDLDFLAQDCDTKTVHNSCKNGTFCAKRTG